MSWATDGLSPEELRRFRGVQRMRHGLAVAVYTMAGNLAIPMRLVAPGVRRLIYPAMSAPRLRIVFEVGGHQWAEVHDGRAWKTRGTGTRGGWVTRYHYEIPLP